MGASVSFGDSGREASGRVASAKIKGQHRRNEPVKRIVIVDYGLGNLRSVSRGLEKCGASPVITSDLQDITSAEGIVLPGVGAFRDGMEQLAAMGKAITDASRSVPVLGICLGMQMLFDWSEEHGLHAGLGVIPGTVRKFPRVPGHKVPHMGWNSLHISQPDHPLMEGIPEGSYVYFVHSYYAEGGTPHTLTETDYIIPYASSVTRGNVSGFQFHPEKSGAVGLSILSNFIDLV